MNPRALLLAGTAALLATPAAAQVSDFRLQPAPTPTPSIIGPPAETPAPRPSPVPTAATAAPTPSPTPRIVVPPLAAPTAAPQRSARPAARPSAAAPAPATPTPAPTAAPGAVPSVLPSASATPTVPAPLPAYPTAPVSAPQEPAAPWWPWIVAAFFLGGATFAGLWWLRRRIGPVGALVVPEIERPRVPPPPAPEPRPEPLAAAPEPAPVAPAPAAEPHPLHIAIELRKLTLSLMNATLGYRLTLTNTGPEPLEEIAIAADLIGAHGSLPREVLLANPATELPMTHLVAGLAAGESADVTGEVRVPLAELRPISQGRAQLFVPLARFRIGAAGQEPRCFTLVAGQPSPSGNGAIQPVRLDHGPRVYDGLAGRAF